MTIKRYGSVRQSSFLREVGIHEEAKDRGSMAFDHTKHVFRSPKFQSVVTEAIEFFEGTPVHSLPPPGPFEGSGVYGLYYLGDFEHYSSVRNSDDNSCDVPIYVGKAVPRGWRTARSTDSSATTLYSRLREHTRSIDQAANLTTDDFRCRFMILGGIESDLVVPVEAELIRTYCPLWNSVLDGFGNHDPGGGRYDQAPSEWDVLHPGRTWVERLRGDAPSLADVIAKLT